MPEHRKTENTGLGLAADESDSIGTPDAINVGNSRQRGGIDPHGAEDKAAAGSPPPRKVKFRCGQGNMDSIISVAFMLCSTVTHIHALGVGFEPSINISLSRTSP